MWFGFCWIIANSLYNFLSSAWYAGWDIFKLKFSSLKQTKRLILMCWLSLPSAKSQICLNCLASFRCPSFWTFWLLNLIYKIMWLLPHDAHLNLDFQSFKIVIGLHSKKHRSKLSKELTENSSKRFIMQNCSWHASPCRGLEWYSKRLEYLFNLG